MNEPGPLLIVAPLRMELAGVVARLESGMLAGVPVVRHVFTDDPLRVADLHGADAHLHLLTPVTIDGRQGWYAAELNRPGF